MAVEIFAIYMVNPTYPYQKVWGLRAPFACPKNNLYEKIHSIFVFISLAHRILTLHGDWTGWSCVDEGCKGGGIFLASYWDQEGWVTYHLSALHGRAACGAKHAGTSQGSDGGHDRQDMTEHTNK